MRNILTSFLVLGIVAVLVAQPGQAQTKYTGQLDVLNHLKLSMDEEDVLYEILLLDEDIRFAERELVFTSKRLGELKEICKLSVEFEDIRAKADRKYKRSADFISFLKSDLEEYRSIERKLLYQIYDNQLIKKSRSLKYKKNPDVKKFKKEAEALSLMAEKASVAFNQSLSDSQLVDSLKRMNCLYSKAIDKQRAALAICLNVELPTAPNCDDLLQPVYAEQSSNVSGVGIMENEEEFFEEQESYLYNEVLFVQAKADDGFSLLDISQTASEERLDLDQLSEINHDIVYKVQVGAFYSDVEKNDFNGLNPISIEDNNTDFSKVMVGSYYSYRAAMKARAILIKTTDYNDAFVVAYDQKERISLAEAVEKVNNTSDKQAYISFKSTNK